MDKELDEAIEHRDKVRKDYECLKYEVAGYEILEVLRKLLDYSSEDFKFRKIEITEGHYTLEAHCYYIAKNTPDWAKEKIAKGEEIIFPFEEKEIE